MDKKNGYSFLYVAVFTN